MNDVILKRFEQPDEIVEFEKGKFEIVRIGELVIGRATYQPAGNGPSMLGRLLAQRDAIWNMSAWFSRAQLPPHWMTAEYSSFLPASYSTYRRYRMTVGS